MKLWNFFNGPQRRIRIKEDFEKLCQMMLDAPSLRWHVGVSLDNEFYARLGMSADELSDKLSVRKMGCHNQKHIPTY